MNSVEPKVNSLPSSATQRKIYREYRCGETLENLARRFRTAPDEVVRVVGNLRAEQICELPLSYVAHEEFPRALADLAREQIVLGPPAGDSAREAAADRDAAKLSHDVPGYVAGLYEILLLTRAQEAHLFRKMNYLKYKACRLREKLDLQAPVFALMDQIEACHTEALAVRNQLIRANLRLVVSVARRRVGPGDPFFELVSDGNMALIRAVEKFDFSLGYRFSTYAVEAVENGFCRTISAEHRRRSRFRTGCDVAMEIGADERCSPSAQEQADAERQTEVARMLERLDPRDRQIIIRRFGLERGCEPLKLREISSQLGVTKERVRQIETRALRRLRGLAADAKIEMPS
jgi:RNA polymerase primary sigma factor